MPAFYTVVQYVPDPIADDRISVGVIVFGDGQIRSRFLRNWQPVRRFAGKDIEFLREFEDRIDQAAIESAAVSTQSALPGISARGRIDEPRLRQMIGDWSNSIQLTPAEMSLQEHDELLTTVADVFLREPFKQSQKFRDRQQAARFTVKVVHGAVEVRLGPLAADRAVRPSYRLAGRLVERVKVDLAITNGRVYEATQALSFETHDMAELDVQAHNAIYTLGDVQGRHSNIRLSVVALPPNPELRGYAEARQRYNEVVSSCRRIGARLILEEEAPEWAEGIAELVETEIERRPSGIAH